MTVGAMRKGAIDFIAKPISGQLLLERVRSALISNRLQREASSARSLFEVHLSRLTPREHEVLVLALSGKPNKTISTELGISVRTIEGHRAQIFLKLGIDSLIELAQKAASAGMPLNDITTLPLKP